MKDPSNNLLGSWGSDGEVWYQLWENGQPSLNTGANGLALLDSAVQQAEAAGIQFIMCLVKCVLPPEVAIPFKLTLSKRMAELWRSDRLCQQFVRGRTVTGRVLHESNRRQRLPKLRERNRHKIQRLSRNIRMGAC